MLARGIAYSITFYYSSIEIITLTLRVADSSIVVQ
jgi:hypothetical protein